MPSQRQIMRAVAGAVYNTLHAHPTWKVPPALPGSVAKRAAGTICSQWADGLAGVTGPSASGGSGLRPSCREVGRLPLDGRPKRGASTAIRRSPLRKLVQKLSRPLRKLKKEDPERAAVYIDVLKMIAKIEEER